MFPSFNFVDYVIIFWGTLLCLKRVAEMERYHEWRVVVLTSILSIVVIHFFLVWGFTLGTGIQFGCVPDEIHFTQSPM